MKKYLIPSILILLSFICMIAYKLIGVEVAADGVLVEAFWLIPVGDLLLFVWVIWSIVLFVKNLIKKKKWK